MKTKFPRRTGTAGLAMLLAAYGAGCGVDGDSSRISVTENNDLGVTTLEIDRFAQHDNNIFELRGLDANEHEVAIFRLTSGVIADLETILPAADTNLGSELYFAAAAEEARTVTRELNHFELQPTYAREILEYLDLDAVSTTLEREAHIIIHHASPASAEVPFAWGCAASQLLTSPLARQCCIAQGIPVMIFQRPDNVVVNRTWLAPCKSQSGGPCSGAACFYGPMGFSRAQLTSGTSKTRVVPADNPDIGIDNCVTYETANSTDRYFLPDVTGTQAAGAGCPGGATGAGQWDY